MMNKIEELIQQLCPDGVEFKNLDEVAALTMGTSPESNSFSTNSEAGLEFHQGKTFFESEIIGQSNIYTSSPIKIAEPNSLIMSVRAPVGDTNITNRRIAIGRGLCSMTGKENLLTKFLYYFINENIQKFKNKSNGSTFEAINTFDIKKIVLPVPPLAIQQVIVNILDKFNQLEAELEARRAQYDYYRNQLLNFEGKEVEWKTLGEIGNFIRGKRFVKNDIVSEGVPCIHYGEMYTHYHVSAVKAKSYLEPALAKNLRVAHHGDVIIVAAGETVEDLGKGVAWLGGCDVVIHDACFAYSHSLSPKYVSHFFQTKIIRDQITKYVSSGKISSIHSNGLSKAKIPVPPLPEQERIVEILDKFDALVNDLSAGLPAEIAARRKQYEYYRAQLMQFKKKENTATPLQFCRYYRGEEQCPRNVHESGMANIWDYEQMWVRDETLRDLNGLNTQEYIRFGLLDFNKDDGTPLTLKSLLFNRHNHWTGGYGMDEDLRSFKEWYLNHYLGQTNRN